MAISGELFEAKSSSHRDASLMVQSSGLLQLQWSDGQADYPLESVEISSRLGNTPRYINLPDGRKFETRDNDAVDAMLAEHSKRDLHSWQAFLHRLESRMHYVVVALIVVVAFSWGMLRYGLPAAAQSIAYALPQDIMQSATDTTLNMLDGRYLQASEVDASTRGRIGEKFAAMSSRVEQGFEYRLLFRKGGEMVGANAFALPSGTIVLTDELVAIANNDEELLSVLAHELGHVVHRHSLRQVLQNSALSLMITYATGDASSLFIALPVMFVELGYSRKFEHEADQFAYDYMQQHEIPLHSFADILRGIEASHTERRSRHEENEQSGRVVDIFEYLSTHPATEERVKRFLVEG